MKWSALKIKQKNHLQNAGWLTAGQGLSVIAQAIYFFCLGRLLGSIEYGVYVGAFSLTMIFAQYSSLGTGTIFIRYVTGKPDRSGAYWGNLLATTVIGGTITSAAVYFIGKHLLGPESASLVAIAGICNCLCFQLTSECGRVFQAFGRMRWTAFLQLTANVLRAIVAAGMLMLAGRATAWQWSIACLFISGLTAAAAIILVCYQVGMPAAPGKRVYQHAREGLGYSIAMSTSVAYNDLDKTMLSHYGMNAANGIYSMAYRVIDVATIPLFSVREAVLPRLFELGREGIENTAPFCLRLLKRSLPIAICASIAAFVMAPTTRLFFGAGFAESVSAIRWLAIIPVLRSIHHLSGAALTGAGRQGMRTMAQASAAGLNFVLNLWLIPLYGWRGAAWASIAADAFLAIICLGLVHYELIVARSKKNRSCNDRLHVFCGDV
jgi:O-antigen/teichoic acid export membrane protein